MGPWAIWRPLVTGRRVLRITSAQTCPAVDLRIRDVELGALPLEDGRGAKHSPPRQDTEHRTQDTGDKTQDTHKTQVIPGKSRANYEKS